MTRLELPEKKVPTYAQREAAAKKAKSSKRSGYHRPKSRRPRYRDLRGHVRDSKRSYRARCIQSEPLSRFRDFVKLENLPPARPLSLPQRVVKTPAEQFEFDVVDSDSDGEDEDDVVCIEVVDLVSSDEEHGEEEGCEDEEGEDRQVASASDQPSGPMPWPSDVVRIRHAEFPPGIKIRDVGPVDWCGCQGACNVDSCQNASIDYFCSSNNCKMGRSCGNRRRDAPGLELRKGSLGYTVFATQPIPYGQVIGEYAGVVTTHDYSADEEDENHSEYTLALATRSTRGQKLYIEAKQRGGITRFVNHSCDPNCLFFETQNRNRLAILLYALEDIPAGTELRVSYGDDLWFECRCGAANCVANTSSSVRATSTSILAQKRT